MRAVGQTRGWNTPWCGSAWLVLLLVALTPGAGGVLDVLEPAPIQGTEAGVTSEEFGQHLWLMSVSSIQNFPVTCCLFGQQLLNYAEAVWLAGRVLHRGLIEPSFVHQARNSTVYEQMKAAGELRNLSFHAILGTIPVAGSTLFDPWEFSDNTRRDGNGVEISAFATNTTFWESTGGVVDLLIVCDASVIGGQACANTDACSLHRCETLDFDRGPVPRTMEFFGRLHLVNKVVCLPNTTRDLRGQVDEAASDPADLVVAVAMHNRHINAFTGGSVSQTLHPLAIVPHSSTGQELWSVDEHLQADWLSILERFRPSAAIRRAMDSLLLGTPLGGVGSYVGVHWRRGDRAHPEMGPLGARMWELSTPDHLSCEINRLLLEFNVSSVFVGTNCGTPAEYDRLRELVQAPVVFLRDVDMFQEWQQGLDAMTTEMFLLAHAKVFLSAGESHWGSSTIS